MIRSELIEFFDVYLGDPAAVSYEHPEYLCFVNVVFDLVGDSVEFCRFSVYHYDYSEDDGPLSTIDTDYRPSEIEDIIDWYRNVCFVVVKE